MADGDVGALLREYNPWWLDGERGLTNDPELADADASPLRYRPPALADITPPNVYVLLGPRRAGKTTAAKLAIRSLIQDRGVPPQRILYYALDLVRDYREIPRIVRAAKALHPRTDGPWYIFLDEISRVRDWAHAVKSLRDLPVGRGDCYVLTGSSSADLARGSELLPGRRGSGVGLDRRLLPLSFPQFVGATVRGLPRPPASLQPHAFLDTAHDALLQESALHLPLLVPALETYARVGGFPGAVRDHLANGRLQDATVRDLWSILAGDLNRRGAARGGGAVLAFKLLERVNAGLGSPTNWHHLARELDTAANTAHAYVQLMADSFLLLVVYFLEGTRLALRMDRKLYPTDPVLARLPALVAPVHGTDPSLPQIVEAIVAMALFRNGERDLLESFGLPQSLFYWKSTRGREVDFLSGDGRCPFEVKYQRSVSGHDTQTISQTFGRGVVLSIDTLDLSRSVRVIPTALFLWLLRQD